MGSSGPLEAGYRRLHAAAYDPIVGVADRLWLAPHRQALADGLTGRVLDLGCGTGRTFPALAGADVSVVGVDPDPSMLARAHRRGAALDLDVTLVRGAGESLPLGDGTIDAAVVSLALCTVDDRAAVRRELARVLAPGGELRLFEHVRGSGWRGRAQRMIARPWGAIAGGCDITARQHEPFLTDDAFEVLDVATHHIGVFPTKPFVSVRLARTSSDDGEQ